MYCLFALCSWFVLEDRSVGVVLLGVAKELFLDRRVVQLTPNLTGARREPRQEK